MPQNDVFASILQLLPKDLQSVFNYGSPSHLRPQNKTKNIKPLIMVFDFLSKWPINLFSAILKKRKRKKYPAPTTIKPKEIIKNTPKLTSFILTPVFFLSHFYC
ncbi:hypothetical protein OFN64_27700, partial [Escherichia coli]|nr:hypothetical protein [Escherichia coli]